MNNGSDRIFRTFPIEKQSIKTETKLVNNNDLLKQKINLQIEKDKIFAEIEIKKEKCENKNQSMFVEEYILRETKIDNLKEKINLQIEKDKILVKNEIKNETCENKDASMFEKEKFLEEKRINNFREKENLPNQETNDVNDGNAQRSKYYFCFSVIFLVQKNSLPCWTPSPPKKITQMGVTSEKMF